MDSPDTPTGDEESGRLTPQPSVELSAGWAAAIIREEREARVRHLERLFSGNR
jgi:hypothetical protein